MREYLEDQFCPVYDFDAQSEVEVVDLYGGEVVIENDQVSLGLAARELDIRQFAFADIEAGCRFLPALGNTACDNGACGIGKAFQFRKRIHRFFFAVPADDDLNKQGAFPRNPGTVSERFQKDLQNLIYSSLPFSPIQSLPSRERTKFCSKEFASEILTGFHCRLFLPLPEFAVNRFVFERSAFFFGAPLSAGIAINPAGIACIEQARVTFAHRL